MLPCGNAKFIPLIKIVSAIMLSVITSLANTVFHRLLVVPKSYVSVTSGTKSLLMSALNVILSVSVSPICMLPSADMLPVTCTSPLTNMSLLTITFPVPTVLNSKSSSVAVIEILLPVISKSPVTIFPWYTTGLDPVGSKLIVSLELEIILLNMEKVAISA